MAKFRWWPFGREKLADAPNLRPLTWPLLYELATGEPWEENRVYTPDGAMRIAPFAAGVHFLTATIAALPLHIYRRRKRADADSPEDIERVDDMQEDVVSQFWTEDIDAYQAIQQMVEDMLLWGAGYFHIERNDSGRILRLQPLPPGTIVPGWLNGVKYYDYHPDAGRTGGGEPRRFFTHEICEIAYRRRRDMATTISVLHDCSQTLAKYVAVDAYMNRHFQGGGLPPAVVSAPVNTPEAAQRLSKQVNKAIVESNKVGNQLMVLPVMHEMKSIGVDPQASQMVEAKTYLLQEIGRCLNVPPVVLHDLSRGTYSNTEQQMLHVAKSSIRPLTRKIEAAMTASLFGRGDRRSVRFDMTALLAGDTTARFNSWARAIQSGIMTPNEARAREGLPQSELAEAGELLIQSGTTPLDGGANNSPGGEAGRLPPPPDSGSENGDSDA